MNRSDLRRLEAIESYPCVTITMPTHRTHPDNRQDPIRLRNLVQQANDSLVAEVGKRDSGPLLARLDTLVAGVDLRHALDGLALFVNQDYSAAFMIPHTLDERVVIDATFYIRDLVRATNRALRYRVLAIGEKPTRLFEAARDDLNEITAGKFPMVHDRPGGDQRMPGGQGINTSALRDEYLNQFFRGVDAEYRRLTEAEPLPLVLVGIGNHLAAYQAVMADRGHVLTTVSGSHDVTSAHELSRLVWPAAEAAFAEVRQARLSELVEALNGDRVVSGVQGVWTAAVQGRGDTLFVEDGFFYPAALSEDGAWVTPTDDTSGPDTMDDAVDEIITAVLDRGGRVVFVEPDALAQAGRIALSLRY
jgi:hypothetical protein